MERRTINVWIDGNKFLGVTDNKVASVMNAVNAIDKYLTSIGRVGDLSKVGSKQYTVHGGNLEFVYIITSGDKFISVNGTEDAAKDYEANYSPISETYTIRPWYMNTFISGISLSSPTKKSQTMILGDVSQITLGPKAVDIKPEVKYNYPYQYKRHQPYRRGYY